MVKDVTYWLNFHLARAGKTAVVINTAVEASTVAQRLAP